jgi:molecular chaperone DnaK
MTASQKLGEAMYAQAQAEAGAAGGPGGAAGGGPGAGGGTGDAKGDGDEKIVDAEYTEVKDRK